MTPTPPDPPTVEALLHHRSWLQGLARRLVLDPADADDLAQQTWLAALESPPAHGASVRGWLATVLRNFARKRDRAAVRRGFREAQVAASGEPRPTAEVVAHADALRHVTQAVMDLDDPYRTTLLLRFFEDLPPRVVAARMGVPVETVRTRVRRGLALLRERLDGAYGSRRTWCLVLLPLTGADGTPVGFRDVPVGVAALTGIGLMSSTTGKLAAAAAVVILAVGGYWASTSGDAAATEAGGTPIAAVGEANVSAAVPRERGTARAGVSKPPAGSAPAADAKAEQRGPAVRLRLADGSTLAGGHVVAFDDASARLVGPTAADGLLDLELDEAGCGLLAVVPGYRPTVAEAGRPGETTDAVFHRHDLVAGLLRIEGSAAPAGLRLSMSFSSEDGVRLDAPDHAWAELGETGFERWQSVAITETSGRFSFAAPPASTAQIVAPKGYTWTGVEPGTMQAMGFTTRVPDTTLTLDIRPLPVLRGRVIREADGTPVDGATASFRYRGQGFGGSRSATTDESGAFELVVPRYEFLSTRLTVYVSDEAAVLRRELGGSFDGVRELGDLALSTVHPVQLVIQDEHGTPIERAVAAPAIPSHPYRSEPTSSRGRTQVNVMTGRTPYQITAAGFLPREVGLAAPTSTPIVIEMAATTLLRVALPAPGVPRPPGLQLQVAAGTPLFVAEAGDMLSQLGGEVAHPDGHEDLANGRNTYWFPIDDESELLLAGVQPQVPFHLLLVDSYGIVHASHEMRMAAGGRRDIALELDGPGRRITGRVRDAQGRPLVGAMVQAAGPPVERSDLRAGPMEDPGVSVRTDAEGRFEVPAIHASRVRLVASCDGFVSQPGLTADTSSGDVELEIRMLPGRTVPVRVEFDDGTPIEDPWAWAELPTQPWSGRGPLWPLEESDGGGLVLRDIPAEDMVLVIEDDRHRMQRIPFDARDDEIRIVVKRARK